MKQSITRRFLRHGLARVAVKRLSVLSLSLLALPCLLPAQTLLHRYSFVSDASDSVGGSAWNGTVVSPGAGSPATINNGLSLPGGGGGGFSGYVALPNGILTSTTNITVEVWATQNTANEWGTIWAFANNGSQNFALIPYPGNNNNHLEVAFTPHGNENDLQSSLSFPTGTEQYVAVTFNNASLVANLYTNGAQVATLKLPDTTYTPGVIGGTPGTSQNWLGNDTYGDTQFQGTVYELRIWNGVVSQRYLAASTIVGPSVLINNLTPTSATLTAGPSVVITGTEQAAMTVTLAQTASTPLLATQDATNWVSSNPNVLAVNSSGLVTGVSAGTATISAKVAGVSATSGTITVTGPQTLLHRYSFVSDASDSVGGAQWNGSIIAAGNVNGTNVTISHGLYLPGGGGGDYSAYVAFPAGILTNTTSVTIECWATQNAANTWAEIWNFANDGSHTTGLIPEAADDASHMEVALQPNGNNVNMQSTVTFPNGSEQYICSTYNNSTLTGDLYDNGALVATASYPNTSYAPGSIGGAAGTAQNWLGNDTYGDSQFQGTVYEFRIWNGALSPVYAAVAAAAGPSIVVTNLTPTSLTVTITNSTMIGAQTQQASVVGNFADASDVTVTGGVTNWTSSNPTILTVNSSGLITAQSGGNATISATVNGVTATSSSITVALTTPTATGPVNETLVVGQTATFSVSALGGQLSYQWSFNSTPIPGATNASLVITNIAYTNAGIYSVAITNTLGSIHPSATLAVVQQILQHRYSFINDASDSVGGAAWKGTVVAPNGGTAATIANGLTLPGGGGGGFSGYVTLPAGILTNTASVTVETWVTQNSAQQWATVWDFAVNTGENFEMCPFPQRGILNLDVAIEPNGGEVDTVTGSLFPSGTMQYVSFTFNTAGFVGQIYTNGALAATQGYSSGYIPGQIGGAAGTTVNALGNDIFNDAQFQGTIYEFRIWNGAVSPLYLAISAAAGPGVVVTNLTPTSVAVTVTNSSLIPGQTESATVTGNFVDASGIPVTGAATNWVSSNTGVLTVNSSGVITAVNTGSATVSATVNGVVGTSSSITVPNSLPVITQQPPASESFLVGATATASIGVQGTPPFVYRWYLNSGATPVSTATNNPVLTLPDVQLAQAGNYTCLVSNQYGTALSSAVAIAVAAPSTYDQTILELGPIGYWPLNETSGTIAYDVVGGNNGTYTNFPSVTGSSFTLDQPGPSASDFGGNSLSVQLLSSIVDIPGASFNFTGPVTAVAWVQLIVTPTFDGIVGKGDSSYRISVNPSSQPGGNDGTSAAADATSTTALDGNWHMLAYTYTGKPGQNFNGLLYVDGTLVASNTVVTAPTGDNLDVWIGGSPDYGSARLLQGGNVADVAIFNKALTPAQVQGAFTGTFVQGPVSITINKVGSNVVLTWPTGTLQQATTLNGTWTTDSTATSPYTVPATNNVFFRVLVSQ